MINLTPNEEKKIMIKNFYYRLTTVVFSVLGLTMLIASATLVPSYVISLSKKNFLNDLLNEDKAKELDVLNQQTLAMVSELDAKLSILEKATSSKFIVSERIINEILLEKANNLKVTQISFENIQNQGKIINVRGIAPSRERLAIFHRALANNPAFQKVDLPISNFVQGSNIQFFLSLTPNEN